MTPKEKALELVNSFVKLYDHQSENYLALDEAKLCALIALNEIKEFLKFIHKPEYTNILIQGQFINIYESIEYWEEVEQEIEKL
jgi:hypothetical protein